MQMSRSLSGDAMPVVFDLNFEKMLWQEIEKDWSLVHGGVEIMDPERRMPTVTGKLLVECEGAEPWSSANKSKVYWVVLDGTDEKRSVLGEDLRPSGLCYLPPSKRHWNLKHIVTVFKARLQCKKDNGRILYEKCEEAAQQLTTKALDEYFMAWYATTNHQDFLPTLANLEASAQYSGMAATTAAIQRLRIVAERELGSQRKQSSKGVAGRDDFEPLLMNIIARAMCGQNRVTLDLFDIVATEYAHFLGSPGSVEDTLFHAWKGKFERVHKWLKERKFVDEHVPFYSVFDIPGSPLTRDTKSIRPSDVVDLLPSVFDRKGIADDDSLKTVHIMLVGSNGVGKNSVLQRFRRESLAAQPFDSEFEVHRDQSCEKEVEVFGQKIKARFWAADQHASQDKKYNEACDGILYVYDNSDAEQDFKSPMQQIQGVLSSHDDPLPIAFFGNKTDMRRHTPSDVVVNGLRPFGSAGSSNLNTLLTVKDTNGLEELVRAHAGFTKEFVFNSAQPTARATSAPPLTTGVGSDAQFFWGSAKSGLGVDEVFEYIVKEAVKQKVARKVSVGKRGHLEKQGVFGKTFKRRFFQVSASLACLRYANRDCEQNSQWQKEIPFDKITSVEVAEGSENLRSFCVVTRQRTYSLRAESNVEMRRWIQAIALAKAAAIAAVDDTAGILAAVDGHPDLSPQLRHSRSMSSIALLGSTMFGSWSKSDDAQQDSARDSPPPASDKHSPMSQRLSATPTPTDKKGWARKNFENTIIQWARQYFVDSYPAGATASGEHGLGPDAFCRFLSAVFPENILRDEDDRVVWIHESACDHSWLGVFNEIAPMAMHLSVHPIPEAFRVAANYIQSHPLSKSSHYTYLTVKNHTARKLGRQLTSVDTDAIKEAMTTKHVLEKRDTENSMDDGRLLMRSAGGSMSMRSAGGSIEGCRGGNSEHTSDEHRHRSTSGLGRAINGSIEFYLDGDDEQLATGNAEVVYRGGASLFSAANATGNTFAQSLLSVPPTIRRSQSDLSAQRKYRRDNLVEAANTAALRTHLTLSAPPKIRSSRSGV
jgi:GTPase SAR1 family protein